MLLRLRYGVLFALIASPLFAQQQPPPPSPDLQAANARISEEIVRNLNCHSTVIALQNENAALKQELAQFKTPTGGATSKPMPPKK